jgi:hypothetical protein
MGIAMDGIWFVYLFLAAFPGLIIFAAIYKWMEVRHASMWPSTPGRVVVSTTEAREVSRGTPNSTDTELRTFAKIEYEYTIAGRKYRCKRVSIGEDLGNFEVAETVARYPVGKAVTVYYNPSKRGEAVLERDVPPGIWKGVTIIVLVLIGLILGGIFGYRALENALTGVVTTAGQAPFVAACIGFAFLASLVIYAVQRHAALQRGWPKAQGRIESSDVHAYQSTDSKGRWQTYYRADVTYSYEVANVRYTGDKIGSVLVGSTSDGSAKRTVARYAPGRTIEVHYDLANPAQSILKPGGYGLLLFWLIPAAVLVLAFFTAR